MSLQRLLHVSFAACALGPCGTPTEDAIGPHTPGAPPEDAVMNVRQNAAPPDPAASTSPSLLDLANDSDQGGAD